MPRKYSIFIQCWYYCKHVSGIAFLLFSNPLPGQQLSFVPGLSKGIAEEVVPHHPTDFNLTSPTLTTHNTALDTRNFPSLQWPLGKPLYQDLFLMNYYDQSGPGQVDGQFRDYHCGRDLGYDGHTGTDITLFNFRLMDIGMPILAAAPGEVVATRWHIFDRNYNQPYATSEPNLVRIRHLDGTEALYVHMRKNSIAVNVGERIQAGEFLGYVASSGTTPMPHLHFELWEPGAVWPNNVAYRDPFEGNCHSLPSLWQEQEAYVPHNDLWIMDMGVTTVEALGGDLSQLTNVPFKDRPSQPHHFGQEEPFLIVWTMVQSPPGRSYTVELYDPNGDLEGSETRTINSYIRYGWDPFVWNFAGVPSSDFGEWEVLIKQNGQVLRRHTFEVQANTYYGPRFFPLAGKSLRLTNGSIQDQLSLSPFGSSAVNFELLNAPTFVSLQDSIVRVRADENLNRRNYFFQVKATDELGLSDTMWYHVVAPNEARGDLNSSDDPRLDVSSTLRLQPIVPNPNAGQFLLQYELSQTTSISISLFNAQGQKMVGLVSERQPKGKHQFPVAAQEFGLVPGVYWVKYQTASTQKTQKVIIQ